MKLKVVGLMLLVATLVGCAGRGGWVGRETPNDPNYLFAWGNGQSRQLQLAVNQAALAARANISRAAEIRLQSLQKSFAEQIGAGQDAELLSQYTESTKAVTSMVMVGSTVKKEEYKQEKDLYHARVLVEYPIGATNAALAAQIKSTQNLYTRFRAAEGFKELEAEAEKYEQWKKSQ